MDQIIRMIMRMGLLRIVNKGVDMGVRHMSRRKQDEQEQSPEDRARANQSEKETSKKLKQSMRIAKRFGRF